MRQLGVIQAVLVTGLVSVLVQTLLVRELLMIFYGNELIIAFMISAWLIWGAVGSITGAWLMRRHPPTAVHYAGCQIMIALILPLELLLVRGLKPMFGLPVGELTDPLTILILSFVVLAPVGLVNGFQFTTGGRILSQYRADADGGAGRVYGLDAIGDMVGAALFGYVCVRFFSPLMTVLAASFLSAMSAAALSFGARRNIASVLGGLLALGFAAGAALLPVEKWDLKTRGWNWPKLTVVGTATSIHGDISIVKYGSIYSVYENGLLSFSVPLKLEAEEQTHLTMVQTPKPRRVLIFGGALPGVLHEVMKYPLQEVYYVESNPALIELVRPYLGSQNQAALADPRLRITTGDGRAFVKKWRGTKFDVVIVNAGDPVTLFLNRFYTSDFFRELTAIMSRQGVIRIAVSSKEAYLSDPIRNYNGSIYHTLKQSFPYVQAIPGDRLVLLASQDSSYLSLDPQVISRRLADRGVATEFISPGHLESILLPHQIAFTRDALERARTPGLNHDLRPIAFSYGLVYWSTYFRPLVRQALGFLRRLQFPWLALLLAVILTVSCVFRSRRRNAMIIVAGVMGFQGMTAVIMSVLFYEMLFGYVHHRIGLLIAGFMLGLFLGTTAALHMPRLRPEHKLLAALLGSLLYWLTLAWGFGLRPGPALSSLVSELAFVLTVVPGFMVGAAFSSANQLSDAGERLPQLYAADLVGGSLGGLIASLVLIPNHGLRSTCVLLGAAICICSLFTLAIVYKPRPNGNSA